MKITPEIKQKYFLPRTIQVGENIVLRSVDVDGPHTTDTIRHIYDIFASDTPGALMWFVGSPCKSPEDLLLHYQDRACGSMFWIYLDDELVGEIGLIDMDRVENIAYIGYWLAPAVRGRGIIARCLPEIENLAFIGRGSATVYIACDEQNVASRRVAQRAGYSLDGILRSFLRWRDGTRHSRCIYSKLKSEWEKEFENA